MRFPLERAARRELLKDAPPAVPAYIPNVRELIEADSSHLASQFLWIEATEYARGPHYPPVASFAFIVNRYFNAMANDQIPPRVAAQQITAEVNAALRELEAAQ